MKDLGCHSPKISPWKRLPPVLVIDEITAEPACSNSALKFWVWTSNWSTADAGKGLPDDKFCPTVPPWLTRFLMLMPSMNVFVLSELIAPACTWRARPPSVGGDTVTPGASAAKFRKLRSPFGK